MACFQTDALAQGCFERADVVCSQQVDCEECKREIDGGGCKIDAEGPPAIATGEEL